MTAIRWSVQQDPNDFTPLCWLPAGDGEWAVEQGRDGWYVVRPFGLGCHGPYASERGAQRALVVLRTRAGD